MLPARLSMRGFRHGLGAIAADAPSLLAEIPTGILNWFKKIRLIVSKVVPKGAGKGGTAESADTVGAL
jgi:hypothetical protein